VRKTNLGFQEMHQSFASIQMQEGKKKGVALGKRTHIEDI
jgi:hypothetical protein